VFLTSFMDMWLAILVSILVLLSPLLLKPFSFLKKNQEIPLIWIVLTVSLVCFLILHYFALLFTVEIYIAWIMTSALLPAFLLIMYLLEKFSIIYGQQLESALYEQEKEYYHTQYQLMKETIETTKEMKHDLNLHLNSLNEQLKISPE